MTDAEAEAWRAVLICYAHPKEALAVLRKHLGDEAPADVVALFEAWAAEGGQTRH